MCPNFKYTLFRTAIANSLDRRGISRHDASNEPNPLISISPDVDLLDQYFMQLSSAELPTCGDSLCCYMSFPRQTIFPSESNRGKGVVIFQISHNRVDVCVLGL